jgi:acetaldehyde dehydrogenase (acetylating)
MDNDLRSIQQARELVHGSKEAQKKYKEFSQEQVDRVVEAMVTAGVRDSERLARAAHEETGFGRVESKTAKNLFATRTLLERMRGMRTVGIIARKEDGAIWEVATPMGVVAALIPSTNPTSTAMYKAIIAAKAGCGIVMSPHPRAAKCTAEALKVVAEAAYSAGAPKGLFGCMTDVSIPGTDALLEHPEVDVILATGGSAMVRAAYSKGKPAYGVGSGNVPVYVDRSADIEKAAKDIMYGVSFDWGTLCSTERSVIADAPIKSKLVEAMKREGAHFMSEDEKDRVRKVIIRNGRFNADQVGQSPKAIARMAGFSVPESTRALVGEVNRVGKEEPISMETLSPILGFYVEDGWQAGCDRCVQVLEFGGIGHTLGIHCTNERVVEEFALKKPSMRIVVNTVAALGSVGYTNRLFPALTLGPGTLGGSITSDNISPLHLLNVKRVAFETAPINPPSNGALEAGSEASVEQATRSAKNAAVSRSGGRSWMDEIDARLRARAGNAPSVPVSAKETAKPRSTPRSTQPLPEAAPSKAASSGLPLSEEHISELMKKFRK